MEKDDKEYVDKDKYVGIVDQCLSNINSTGNLEHTSGKRSRLFRQGCLRQKADRSAFKTGVLILSVLVILNVCLYLWWGRTTTALSAQDADYQLQIKYGSDFKQAAAIDQLLKPGQRFTGPRDFLFKSSLNNLNTTLGSAHPRTAAAWQGNRFVFLGNATLYSEQLYSRD